MIKRFLICAVIFSTFGSGITPLAGKSSKKKGGKPGSELLAAPPSSKLLENPYRGKQDAILAGKKLVQRHCAQCHNSQRESSEKAPDLKSPYIQNTPPGSLFWFLKNGNLKDGMPAWSRLPDPQLWQIVTYVQTQN